MCFGLPLSVSTNSLLKAERAITFLTRSVRTQASRVSESTGVSDAASSTHSEPACRDAGRDCEEQEEPVVKKMRRDLKIISGRVDAVGNTCAEVKSTTFAEVARLREHIGKIEADQQSHNATVRHRLENPVARNSLEPGQGLDCRREDGRFPFFFFLRIA